MATWSKVKRQMEEFLAEGLNDDVSYTAGSYRFSKDKAGQCYLKVRNQEIFAIAKAVEGICWYQNEQEVKKQQQMIIEVTEGEMDALHQEKPKIPVERLADMIREQKRIVYCKKVMEAQNQLLKSNFIDKAVQYLGTSLEKNLESDDILLNVFALVDRRLGKSRLRKMKDKMTQKHPAVQFFYQLRCSVEKLNV